MTLKLNGSSSGYTAIDAPAAAGSNTLVLPTTNGSAGQVLTTDGSGNLTWANDSGKLLQVVQTKVTAPSDISCSTAGTFYNIAVLNRTITPASSSSKILLSAHVYGEGNNSDEEWHYRIGRSIGGTANQQLAIGDAGGAQTRVTGTFSAGYGGADSASTPVVFTVPNFLDSPTTTSEITYQIYVGCQNASKTFYLNKTVNDSDHASYERGASWVTVMEVAG